MHCIKLGRNTLLLRPLCETAPYAFLIDEALQLTIKTFSVLMSSCWFEIFSNGRQTLKLIITYIQQVRGRQQILLSFRVVPLAISLCFAKLLRSRNRRLRHNHGDAKFLRLYNKTISNKTDNENFMCL